MARRAIASLVLGLSLLATLHVPSAQAVTAVNLVGTLDRVNTDALFAFGSIIDPATSFPGNPYAATAGTLLPLPAAGQLWQVYPHVDDSPNTAVLVRDDATLTTVASFTIAERLRRGGRAAWGGEWMHAVDGGTRVFLVGDTSIVSVDLATFAVTTVANADIVDGFQAIGLAGITYDGAVNALYALHSGVPSLAAGHAVSLIRRIDLMTGASIHRVVRSCRGFPAVDSSLTMAASLLVGASDLYLACNGVNGGMISPPDQAVVRLPLATAFDPAGAEQAVTGTGPLEGAIVDQSSGRMFLAGADGRLSAFDTAPMAYAWSIPVATSAVYGIGRNAATGEIYFQSSLGFGVLDGTSPTAPTPFVLTSAAGPGQERIVSQPGTDRAFVLPDWSTWKPAAYTIYEIVP
ncbi:MAG TPA: hypothetical protein VM938_00615 [Acidimicrobiales bacterium]|nr:hypothetical protein [Acidimicrobiales bacterium]